MRQALMLLDPRVPLHSSSVQGQKVPLFFNTNANARVCVCVRAIIYAHFLDETELK